MAMRGMAGIILAVVATRRVCLDCDTEKQVAAPVVEVKARLVVGATPFKPDMQHGIVTCPAGSSSPQGGY